MLIFPHRVLRRFVEENVAADRTVNGIGYGFSTLLDVQLSPTSSDAAYRDFGVELSRPHFLCWDGPASEFPVGTLIEDSAGRLFIVSSPPKVYDFGNASDHCDCVAEELQYEPTSIERTPQDGFGLGLGSVVGPEPLGQQVPQ